MTFPGADTIKGGIIGLEFLRLSLFLLPALVSLTSLSLETEAEDLSMLGVDPFIFPFAYPLIPFDIADIEL